MTMIVPRLPTVSFPPGGFLTRQGETGDTAWLILEGEADVLVTHGETKKKVVRLSARHVVGEMALISQGPRTATVVANSPLKATEIPRASFEKLLDDCEPLARHIIVHLINAIRAERGLDISALDIAGPMIRSTEESDRILERRTFGSGHIIFREDDPAEAAYLIQSGGVMMIRENKPLAKLGAGRTFGEIALLRGTKRSAGAIVTEAGATVEIIRRREFDQAFERMPKILQALARAYLTYLTDFGG